MTPASEATTDITSRDAGKLRVLVVHSVWDWITSNRVTRIRSDSRARQYSLMHLYPLTVEGDSVFMDESGFRECMFRAVHSHQPEVIVIHTGLAFRSHTEAYASVLADVMSSYPKVRFATDDRGRLERLGLTLPMASDEEAARLIEVLF